MKQFYRLFSVLLALPLIILLFAYNSGSPGGKTGSMGDGGSTCTDCHSGSATAQTGWITSNIPAEGYTPGTTYQITATGTHSGVSKLGFELTAENSTGQKTGTFAISDAARTKLANQNKAITHTAAGNSPSGSSNTWTANWTAPATDVGQIRFYAAFNAANGNGGTSGDVIYTSTLFVNAMAPAALLSIIPNSQTQGENVTVTITGQNTNWSGTAPVVKLVSASSTEILSQSLAVNSNTSLTATFFIPLDAMVGVYSVHVGSLVLANAFTVTVINSIASADVNSISMYPNPATDKVWIETADPATIHLFDLNGRQVREVNSQNLKTAIELYDLRAGIYFVEIKTGNQHTIDKLIVR